MIKQISQESKKCWWCGSDANSGEHRHKKSDLKRIFGKKFEGKPVIIKNNKIIEIQGPNSKLLKFKKVLCKKCNNEVSQPFDKAYDRFISYIETNRDLIIKSEKIDFTKIFETNALECKKNVFRYYIKHIACRLATNNYSIEPEIIDYLNGKCNLKYIYIKFEIRYDIISFMKKIKKEIPDFGNLYLGPFRYVKPNKETDMVNLVHSYINYQWF
ncbi:MAG: hypothetical protein IMY72_06140 [Bacteroidetes bacterium]|nr:hypothetical protein [Bacteroidota bacterium]